jgi:hypothetical protein
MVASLKSRLARLEQQGGGGGEPLIVTFARLKAPDDAFNGFNVNGEFFARNDGETIDETKTRVAELMRRRRDARVYVLKPVMARTCKFAEELPE